MRERVIPCSVLKSGDILDGYQLIRFIGAGGFGEVWLSLLKTTGEYRALKFLPETRLRELERELKAVIRYRAATKGLHSRWLLPIEHINRSEHALYYTMPLADGLSGNDPEEESWMPKTLAAVIEQRKQAQAWFSSLEVKEMIAQVLLGLDALHGAGVAHRDVKPENILFFDDRLCLGDVSLVAEDATFVTVRGTPGYAAPSWYLESGGDPDMWGIAATFFTLLTGNAPDKLGRPRYLWPAQGEESLSRPEKEEWKRLHCVIWRATHEFPLERYRSFLDMRDAILDMQRETEQKTGLALPAMPEALRPRKRVSRWKLAWYVVALSAIGGWLAVAWGLYMELREKLSPPAPAASLVSSHEAEGLQPVHSATDEEEALEPAERLPASQSELGRDIAEIMARRLNSRAENDALQPPAPAPFSTRAKTYFRAHDPIPAQFEYKNRRYDIQTVIQKDLPQLELHLKQIGLEVQWEFDWWGIAGPEVGPEEVPLVSMYLREIGTAFFKVATLEKWRLRLQEEVKVVRFAKTTARELTVEGGVLMVGIQGDPYGFPWAAKLFDLLAIE